MNTNGQTKSLLPPIPKPPHDPTWRLLDGLVGWQEATLKGLERHPVSQALVMAPSPRSQRALTESSGSFGGLTVPTHVALAADGSPYLLDRTTAQLQRFDPCTCAFEGVPHFVGIGSGACQLQAPHGIGIHRGNLYVCDTGNHRLSLFALPELVLRTNDWKPPASAKLNTGQALQTWEPFDVAFNRRGRVFVTDQANNCVHRFSPSGLWEAGFAVSGPATHLAIDCRDTIYVVVQGQDTVQVLDALGQTIKDPVGRVALLREHFPCLPFEVDAQGRLHLRNLCVEELEEGKGIFDENGASTTIKERRNPPRFAQQGCYITGALDSKLYRCQWHRIVLRGDLPVGTSLTISTFTADTEPSNEHIRTLPDTVWGGNLVVYRLDKQDEEDDLVHNRRDERCEWDGLVHNRLDKQGEWDGLVHSGPGRYLWLKIVFRGGGDNTPTIRNIKVEFPRISLRRFLPAVFGEDPVSTDFTDRFLSLFDTTFRSIEHQIDTQARLFDPLSTPADKDPSLDFLTWLASWIVVSMDRQWSETKRRQFLKRAGRLFADRGTREGLWHTLLFFLGIEPDDVCCLDSGSKTRCRPARIGCAKPEPPPCAWLPPPLILEHFKLRRWLFVGAGRLGDQAVLWGRRIVNRSQLGENAQVSVTQLKTTQDPFRDPFHVYAHKFSVFVPASYGRLSRERRVLENLIQAEKPAHTQLQLVFVEPRFRIGFQSMIGLDAVIGCYPEGVTLGATPLGPASVLSEGPQRRGAPTLRVGQQARIGTTTLLD